MPEYPTIQAQHGIEVNIENAHDDMSKLSQRMQWNGFRLEDAPANHVAQFTDTGIAFSRVKSYESWENFKTEALRV